MERLSAVRVAATVLLIVAFWRSSAAAQSIFTLAGGNTSDGRAATFAALENPGSVAVDGSGNLYIADTGNNRIRRLAALSGIISTVAGNGTTGFSGDGGPATTATLAAPSGVALDSAGNLYIADSLNNRVRKIVAGTGVISTIAGNGTQGFSGDGGPATAARLFDPEGLVVDASGNVYIADTQNNRIRKVTVGSGIISTLAGNGTSEFSGDGGPATVAGLFYPGGVAVDTSENLFIADSWNSRIRRVAASNGIISTVAGTGGGCGGPPNPPCGYGGPATATVLSLPHGVAVDTSGNLYVADTWGERVGKIGAGSTTISLVAGNSNQAFSGDGGPATSAAFFYPTDVAVDSSGSVYIADSRNNRIRKVVAGSGIILTVAGGYIGDGGLAADATLLGLQGIVADAVGNLYMADGTDNRIRRVDAAAGTISTVAGNGKKGFSGDGDAATVAALNLPEGVAVDAAGNLYIADSNNERIRKVSAATGVISTVAGNGAIGFSGDGGPATAATFYDPSGVTVDSSGNLYIADIGNNRIRKVAAGTGIISTVAGIGTQAFAGDGGAATAAALDSPAAVAIDGSGNLYVADLQNSRIRKIAAGSGIISTVAGNGTSGFSGDGGAATAAAIEFHFTFFSGTGSEVAVDASGNLYMVDSYSARIRKVAAGSGIISTVAGSGNSGFSGDGGPATAAALNPMGVTVDASGNLFIADSGTNRIRKVPTCVTVQTPKLTQPSDMSSSENTSPKLAWWAATGAFHYDVYLDTTNPPQKLIGSDVVAPFYNPSNLDPLTTYYWRVVAKGDLFCVPFSSSGSQVFSFTTQGSCSPPGAFTGTASGTTITWQPSARASTYDLYLSPSNPPRSYASGIDALSRSLSGLTPGTTYSWKVVAHASCDVTQIAETAIGTFTTPGSCAAAGTFALNGPNDGASTVSATATLSWSTSPGAASYDIYLGSGSNPPLYTSDLQETSVMIPRLSPGADYSWKVVAKAACDTTKSVASAVRRFTVVACGTPAAPTLNASQSTVAAGATYTIRWGGAAGLDAGGSYLVERAADAAFNSVSDHQQTTATTASFVTKATGTYYHRVRAIAGCDTTKRSAQSETVQVTVNTATPMVVFSMLPQAVITKLGDRLEDQKTSFALENLGSITLQVLVGPQLTGSVPFFTIVDPFGGDAAFVMLEPHKPKALDIHFSGPSNTQPGSYQGGIYVMSTGQPLAFTPQAYVNLKVGGDTNAAAPKLLVNGVESEFAYFLPLTGDDSARPAIQVDLQNIGIVPLEVAGEIGPEDWLKMEKDWNSSAVPVSAFRTLRLSTQRTRAVSGSALPRYTYLTVRNKAGQAARLLVEDSGGIVNTTGRSAPLGAGETSAIVPYVAADTAILLTNSGSDPVPVDLVYTPEGSDGFDAAAVLRASIVIPPNDVVSLSDPLVQIFGKSADATGSIEILSAKLAQLAIRAEGRKAAEGGGVYTTSMTVAMRGEGARIDSAHRLVGVTSSASTKTSLIVTETSGREKTTVHIALYDNSGTKRGEQSIDLGRYGTKRIDDVSQTLAGGASLAAGRVDIDVPSGGGAVIALAIVTDRTSGAGAAITAGATAPEVHLSSLGRPIHSEATTAASTQTFTIPGAITNSTLKTTVGVSALAGAVNATVALRDSTTGQTTKQTISVATGQMSEVDIPTGSGTVTVTTDAPVSLYARVRGTNIADALPVVSAYSEGLTGGGSTMPLYADGLEHSIDATRGRKTSLILTELAGQSATVNVRLYEPGSRTAAVAEKDFTIGANSELRLDNLFVSMGMESSPDDLDQRRKNQINVAAVVTATGGNGVIAAQAVMTDNKTGDRRTIEFVPAGGVPATTPQRSATTPPPPTRRRAVGNPSLAIVTTSLPPATVGVGYGEGLTATGGKSPYTWSVSSGLPPGFAINATFGSIFGTPSAAGTFRFTVSVGDSSSPQKTASKELSITVAAAGSSGLSITTTSLPSATVGSGYGQGLAATGGQTPYGWSVSSGLPPGLAINATFGSIFGTPTAAGTFSFTVTVGDSSSPQKTASKGLSITVTSGSAALPPTAMSFPSATGSYSDGGAATAAGLLSPTDVALDSTGNLCIADSSNNRIRKVAGGSGIITTVAGSGAQGIEDSLKKRIRKVTAGSGINGINLGGTSVVGRRRPHGSAPLWGRQPDAARHLGQARCQQSCRMWRAAQRSC
jgi:sugar lactone lactonase YvrE